MTTAILILNWENWPATRRCLDSLAGMERWASEELSVVIVDNGSRDDSVRQIERWINGQNRQEVMLLQAERNLGFAAGNNIGLRWILQQPKRPEFIWLLNNDTMVEVDALVELWAAAQHYPEVKIWGSTLLTEDTGNVEYGGGGYYSPVWSIQRQHMAGSPRSEAQRLGVQLGLDFICAAAMLVRTEVFLSVGLLNEQFFMYFEELDLCERLGNRNEIGWCPSSLVVHSGGASTGQSREGLKKRQYHENLSALKFTAIRHRSCLAPVLLGRLLAKPILFLARRQYFLFRPWWSAYRAFFNWRRSRTSQTGSA